VLAVRKYSSCTRIDEVTSNPGLAYGRDMGDRRRTHALEHRRLTAARLLEQRISQADVARAARVSRQSVSRWAKLLASGGSPALAGRPRRGRLPRLDAVAMAHFARMLRNRVSLRSAEPYLTAEIARGLIERQFGVVFHVGHVPRVLRAAGFYFRWSDERWCPMPWRPRQVPLVGVTMPLAEGAPASTAGLHMNPDAPPA